MEWFKFYGQDWLTDVRINRMRIEDRLIYIAMLCLAAASKERGTIFGVTEDDLIRAAHIPDAPTADSNPYENAAGCLSRYERNGTVTVRRYGDDPTVTDIVINAFSTRQEAHLTNAERQKRYRDKAKLSRNTQRNDRNVRVTTKVTLDKSRVDKRRKDNTTAPSADVSEVINLFKEVNPSYQRLFGMPPQRSAAERLLKTHGMEKLSSMISFLPRSNGSRYAPTITTPAQFEAKLGELIAWSQKQKNPTKEANVAFV